ncbi:MAG: S8 family peptidase [Halioglobus sp.]
MNRTNATVKAMIVAVATLHSASLFAQAPTLLHVMLQGQSTEKLESLVTEIGGTLTHSLPIINAVGAELTTEQFERAKTSPQVQRYIDDLSLTDPEPEEEDTSCGIGSALELQRSNGQLTWQLFNKKSLTLKLSQLIVEWPANLSAPNIIKLGDQLVPIDSAAEIEKGRLKIHLSDNKRPALKGAQPLTITFPQTTQGVLKSTPQHEFSIDVEFGTDCGTSLIPGYTNNHNDTYFPTVVGASSLHAHGITGKGVTVAVLDSGLWEDPVLANDTAGKLRILGRYDAIAGTELAEVFDESGHGTHMTSMIAHSGRVIEDDTFTGSYKGVAPDVNLVAVKAFNEEGQGEFLDIVRGVQWVVDNRERLGIKVLNLSFAARPRWEYWLDPINQAIMRAWAAGITVVAAAGNEGPAPMTIGSPGNLPYIITVGAVTDSWTTDTRDDDYIPDFSSQGPTPDAHIKPDVVAPGGHMTGITRPGSTLLQEFPEYQLSTGEFVMTGTSQAAALVSGVVALLLQLEPDLTPDDVKCKLISSAELAINADGKLAYSPFQQGSGYVSATRAITLGQRGCGNADMSIDEEIAGVEHFQGPAMVNDEGRVSLPGLDTMLSPEGSAKGLSDTRRWGVKEHIERLGNTGQPSTQPPSSPFDWDAIYLQEKTAIENLANQPNP